METDRPNAVPRLRLDFRRVGDRVVLDRLAVCHGSEERALDLEAAHDALQSWLGSMCR